MEPSLSGSSHILFTSLELILKKGGKTQPEMYTKNYEIWANFNQLIYVLDQTCMQTIRNPELSGSSGTLFTNLFLYQMPISKIGENSYGGK